MVNLLALAVLFPAAGALLVWAAAPAGRNAVRFIALGVTVVTLVLAGLLVARFPSGSGLTYEVPWLGDGADVMFSLGLDGLNVWLFGLSALLMVTAVLVGWEAIDSREADYYALLLLLESGMLGVFTARDLILFYVFFEFTLIPLFFLIGAWGSEDRRRAASKFFLYTLAGSVLTFLGLLALVSWVYVESGSARLTFSIPALTIALAEHPLPLEAQLVIFSALFAGFAIKVPLFPLHTWLPLAHVQAPTAGSVILAGVLLKIGGYGFLRFSMPMLPEATAAAMPWMLGLSAAGIIYGALVALVQTDIKRLIAYSSVSHLGFCLLGMFALNRPGIQGGAIQLINHGLSTGGLFAIVGMLYERYHTRDIARLGGIARRTPLLAVAMLLFTFSSIGLPGLNGFVGEFLVLLGMFQRGFGEQAGPDALLFRVVAVASVSGVVLGAWYMLWLVERVFFGPLVEPPEHHAGHGHAAGHGAAHGHGHDHAAGHGHAGGHGDDHGHGALPALPPSSVRDMNFREFVALAPLVVFMFAIGLFPQRFLGPMQAELDAVTGPAMQAAARTTGEPEPVGRMARAVAPPGMPD